ncbi:MAG TPA: hypothetical protein VFX97_19845 [Pyrinomonadaceae bacterium]|nr:hypothetical protein [Pyrinomonadaceae bacterium]
MPSSKDPERREPVRNSRYLRLLKVTKRLILMTLCGLLVIGLVFGVTLIFGKRFMVSWACFGCGLVGGFVSIQQRLKQIPDEELELLSRSWFQILLIPVYGGVFAIVLYLAFLGGIIEGAMFPRFSVPEFAVPPSSQDMKNLFTSTYPTTGPDLAKLIFWSFIAGFSERFVPQIISKTTNDEK